ncbi:hypothetical protein [Micromonospora chersina]|uniref:hypothetical protein n=1 Tax=Micromonospora chersina TaxID=47854 RepID=UPI0033B45F4C
MIGGVFSAALADRSVSVGVAQGRLGARRSACPADTDRDKQNLKLIESESYTNGIQKLVYDVIG